MTGLARAGVLVAFLAAAFPLSPDTSRAAMLPTSDDRRVSAAGLRYSDEETASDFLPFDGVAEVYELAPPEAFITTYASQNSQVLPDGIAGTGSACQVNESTSPWPYAAADSVLEVDFSLSEWGVFLVTASLTKDGSDTAVQLLLERLAPSPEVLVSTGSAAVLAKAGPLLPGDYRFLASAHADGNSSGPIANSSEFDAAFTITCSSATSTDSDGDQVVDDCDICPSDPDPGQEDFDGDGIGNACNDAVDGDGDGWADSLDNCPGVSNPTQWDTDGDGVGDACQDVAISQILDYQGDGAGNVLDTPASIAVAPDGTVYVGGLMSRNIFEVAPNGAIRELFDGATYGAPGGIIPADLALGSDGSLYVAGWGNSNHVALKITPEGTVSEIIDASGDGQGATLNHVGAVAAAPDGRVFVAGMFTDNVFEVTPSGGITEILDASGDGAGSPLDGPSAVAVDAAGNVYVAGAASQNGFRVSPAGEVTKIIDTTTAGSNFSPNRVAVGPDGSVYFSGPELYAVRPSGAVERMLPGSWAIESVALDATGNAFFAVWSLNKASRISPFGEVSEVISLTGDGYGRALREPRDIAVGPGNRLYVCGYASHNVFRIQLANPVPALGGGKRLALSFALAALGCWICRRRDERAGPPPFL